MVAHGYAVGEGDVGGEQAAQRRVCVRDRRVKQHVGDAHGFDREPRLDRRQYVGRVANRVIRHAVSIPLATGDVKRFRIALADVYGVAGGGGVSFSVGFRKFLKNSLACSSNIFLSFSTLASSTLARSRAVCRLIVLS